MQTDFLDTEEGEVNDSHPLTALVDSQASSHEDDQTSFAMVTATLRAAEELNLKEML